MNNSLLSDMLCEVQRLTMRSGDCCLLLYLSMLPDRLLSSSEVLLSDWMEAIESRIMVGFILELRPDL